MLTNQQKGAEAEFEFMLWAVRNGYMVLKPALEGCRYDVLIERGGEYTRVQIKYVTPKGDRIKVDLRKGAGTNHLKRYTADEVDLVAVYDGTKFYFIPPSLFHDKSGIYLRLSPPGNGQTKGINLASDYIEFRGMAQSG